MSNAAAERPRLEYGMREAKRQTAIANQIADNYRDSKGKAITPKNKGAYLYTEQPK